MYSTRPLKCSVFSGTKNNSCSRSLKFCKLWALLNFGDPWPCHQLFLLEALLVGTDHCTPRTSHEFPLLSSNHNEFGSSQSVSDFYIYQFFLLQHNNFMSWLFTCQVPLEPVHQMLFTTALSGFNVIADGCTLNAPRLGLCSIPSY